MATTNENQMDTGNDIGSLDPWQAAFDAINNGQAGYAEGAQQPEPGDGADADNEGEGADTTDGDDAVDVHGEPGGPDNPGGEPAGDAGEGVDDDSFGVDEGYIQSVNDDIVEQAKESAIKDVAQAFIKRGIRHRNGKLGATIDDPDICKRDEDGVPTFYNPDTGREFTGDNPRRQAKEWVDDYNAELATAFNEACQKYVDRVVEIEKPRIETLKFAPTYEKLDPVRKAMFDSIVEDYEVQDADGVVVGYSCDLNKALAAVNRQVSMVQQYANAATATAAAKKQENKGPALDMKSSNAAVPKDKPEFKSLAEAMEWEQDQLIAKNRK